MENFDRMTCDFFFVCSQWISHYSSMLVVTGTVSVDTFFLMSGMLLTMSAMKSLDHKYARNKKF
jgi:peptidoglycan/LPS O-acetylase OafA/YrhL